MFLSINDFTLFRNYIYDLMGIWFEESKKYILERRLEKRMEDLSCSSVRDYYMLLKSDSRGQEVSNLINSVTTNETYFFRNLPQIKLFGEELIPKIIEEKIRSGDRTLKIWSSACSTGEEPYTLAIALLENIPDPERWNIQILASDINRQVLDAARRGVYGPRAVKDVHDIYLAKYFKLNNGSYEINSEVKNLCRFFYMNLIDEKAMQAIRSMDVVFCRNVLIYFDQKSSRKAVDLMYDSMRKGGFLFLGHSESMTRISSAFKLVKFSNGIIYMKE